MADRSGGAGLCCNPDSVRLANRLTTSANAIFLQSSAPLYMLLLGPWLLREPIRRHDVLYMLAIAGGLALFANGRDEAVATAPNPPPGNALALASGVTYAMMLAGLRWLGRQRMAMPPWRRSRQQPDCVRHCLSPGASRGTLRVSGCIHSPVSGSSTSWACLLVP